MTDNYCTGLDYFKYTDCFEVDGIDFYRDIFPNNENKGEYVTDFSRPNAIFLYQDEADKGTDRRLRQRIILNDTWEDDFDTYVKGNPMTLCSGVAFRGRRNTVANARQMNALAIDLDGVGGVQLDRFFYYFFKRHDEDWAMPLPTYIVLSGNGAHFYYVFKEPVALFPDIKKQMKLLKESLINRLWKYESTSQNEFRQYGGITQGFRMVGSINSKHNTIVRAFKTGGRVSLEYLNQYVKSENRVNIAQRFKPSKHNLADAQRLYPEWYQNCVAKGLKQPKKWHIKRDLYEWWKRQVDNEAIVGGRRYNFMMCMCAYAIKCDVPREELEKDLIPIFESLKVRKHDNELTENDMQSALKAYDKAYYNMKIKEVENRTGLRIERNKRNGRKQGQHMKVMSAVRDVIHPDGSWRNRDGRPSAATKIHEYRRANPDAKPKDCISDTGLSKNTVYKWWNEEKSNENN